MSEEENALVEMLSAALVAMADAADKCSEAPHFIVQPFLGIYRKHGETIAEARATLGKDASDVRSPGSSEGE